MLNLILGQLFKQAKVFSRKSFDAPFTLTRLLFMGIRSFKAIWQIKYKQRETANDNEIFIKTTIRNLVIYIGFIVVVSVVNYGMLSLMKFYFADGITKLFLDSNVNENSQSATFRGGFITNEDVWSYLNKTLPDGLYFETWYDGNATADKDLGYILYQNKILGKVRIMQTRVRENQVCTIPKVVSNLVKTCYPSYDSAVESKSSFGNITNTSDPSITAWHYSLDDSGSGTIAGKFNSYSPNGFMIDLPDRSDDTKNIIGTLFKHRWIDLNTRSILVEFTVYNGNINYFTQIQLLVEYPPTGGTINSWSIRTSKLFRYASNFDYFVLACEVLFVLYTIFYTIEEILDISFNKMSYFKDIYNIIDISIMLINYITIFFSVYRYILTTNAVDTLLANPYKHYSFTKILDASDTADYLSSLILFFAWIKIFKYVSLSSALNQLNVTLKRSSKDIMSFSVIFFIFFISYGQLAYILFGDRLEDYQSFPKTLFTLFRIILGDFNFVALRADSPLLGSLYFISYVFFCFFLLLNMFFAIINDSYSNVKDENAKAEPEFLLSDYLKLNYTRITDKLTLKHKQLLDIQQMVETTINTGELSYNLFRNELKKKGYVDQEIEVLFNKYDHDGDLLLDDKEKQNMIQDIKIQTHKLKQEFKDFKRKHDLPSNQAKELSDVENGELEARYMSRDDFQYAFERIDRLELKLANVVNRIDKIFCYLEVVEVQKLRNMKDLAEAKQDDQDDNEVDEEFQVDLENMMNDEELEEPEENQD